MLRNDIKTNISLGNEINIWGVSLEYQNKINEILKKFNYYVEKINSSINIETRNFYLEEVYEEIKQAFGRFNPKSDLEMFYYFEI